jgi:hypothetical protein
VVKATVSIGEKFSFTDSRGRYRIKDVPFGRQTLQIKKSGNVLHSTPVEIDAPTKILDVRVP